MSKDVEAVLTEVMSDIHNLIDNNRNQLDKVKSTENSKVVGNWEGQYIGLRQALGIVADHLIDNR